jgi:cytochrome c oxidase cbb3-type subunit III
MKNRVIYLLTILALPSLGMAQGASPKDTYLSNPLFVCLLAVIVLLLALIAVLATALKNIARSEYIVAKLKRLRGQAGGPRAGVIALFLLFSGSQLFAQQAAKAAEWRIGGLDYFTFYFMLGVILCEAAVLAVLFLAMKNLLSEKEESAALAQEARTREKSMLEKLNASVAIEQEEEIMLTHDYDGIRELDNNLPPWWKYGFYATIVFAFVYMIHYHVSKSGDLQTEEYTREVAKAERELAEFLKNSASNVDETNVTLLTTPGDLAAGKEIFTGICATCHGKLGEGNAIGPNLTDEYWLHGGSLADIFKTIKYGWPDKGMQSWKETYSPMQIAQLSSYIKSLKGTNPPNGKDKQGELYIDQAAGDSTRLDADSLKRVVPVDTSGPKVAESK